MSNNQYKAPTVPPLMFGQSLQQVSNLEIKPEDKAEESISDLGVHIMGKPKPLMTHTVRVLTIEEREHLRPVFESSGVPMPDPATSTIVGAVDSGGNVTRNFIVGQLRLHVDPLNIEPGCQHLFRPLARALHNHIADNVGTTDVYLFTPPGRITQMAAAMGFDQEPLNVMSMGIVGTHTQQPVKTEVPKLQVVPSERPSDCEPEQPGYSDFDPSHETTQQ